MSFWPPKKRSPTILRKAIRPKVFGNGQKSPNKLENAQVLLQ